MKLEDFGIPNYSHIKDSEIITATSELVKKLGITSGSTNTVDLYNLLKVYLKNEEKRLEINKILTGCM